MRHPWIATAAVASAPRAGQRPGVTASIAQRLRRIDWARVEAALDAEGWSRLGPLLGADECRELRRAFDCDERFRATVDMERHGFGRGVYRYFAAPLPPIVAALRAALYARLLPTA